MKKNIIFLLLFVFAIVPMAAEDNSCDEYRHIHMTCTINGTCLRYDISNNGTIATSYVDSVWITNVEDMEEIIMSSYAQSRECIDITFLERGAYVIYVQIDNCIMARMFQYRGTPTEIGERYSIDSLKTKEYKSLSSDGTFLIFRGDRTYTVTGQEVK